MSHDSKQSKSSGNRLGRREFIGAAAVTAGAMFIRPSLVRGTAANSAVRVGLLGCGGRGTEDATNMIDTGGARVVALADMFQDQLDTARAAFDKIQLAKGYAAIDAAQVFLGPKAYEHIAASKEVDAIVIATPPYYHPQHLEAVVAAHKHVYVEKPVAVDVPGCKRVIELGKRAEGRLSLDVGFQIRDCPPFVELVRRIHGGALGKIVCGESHYFASYHERPDYPNASPMERRLRNWTYDRVLSGDIIVEQNIHVIDICNWILQAHPEKVYAAGGRLGRPTDGDVYGNYNCVFRYPNGIDVTFSSTQFAKGSWDVTERFFGTKGNSQSPYDGPLGIWGEEPWQAPLVPEKSNPDDNSFSTTGKFHSNLEFADAEKKKAFIESISSGTFHNQSAKGAESALSCILARSAAYQGHELSWDELMKSTEVLDPKIDLNKLR
jgi:myo-inositol 2-dehydrogenase/D-chiro-inositol 1-dehydrogenase